MNWKLRNQILSDPHNTLCDLLHSMKIAVNEICLKTESEEWREIYENLSKTSSLVCNAPSGMVDFTPL